MSHDRTNPDHPPPPEQVAAYVDGELGADERTSVEAWLTDHPEARADVEAWQRLSRGMQGTGAPEPSPTAWQSARVRVEAALAVPPRRRAISLRRVALALPAAAVVLIAFLARGWFAPAPVDEPFPVVAAQDVVILSIDPGDASALVVGQPPAFEPIVLASADEVTLVSVEPFHADGIKPDMWQGSGGGPMIVPPGEPDDR